LLPKTPKPLSIIITLIALFNLYFYQAKKSKQ